MDNDTNAYNEGLPFIFSFSQKIRSEMSQTARYVKRIAWIQSIVYGGFLLITFGTVFFAASTKLGMIPPAALFMGLFVLTILFIPILYLFRYARNTQKAFMQEDQPILEEAFYNMKRYWYLMWIYLVVGMALYFLTLIFWLFTLAMVGTGGGVGI